tara:strand:- start:538 stop:1422 length:885 start_codon:yes stop_codon:yes gene_type:complete
LNGCLNLVTSASSEEEYYDEMYSVDKVVTSKINWDDLRNIWLSPIFPIQKNFLYYQSSSISHHFKDFKDSTILSLGSGISEKELYFLHLGAKLIYTDLSHNAVSYIKKKVDLEIYEGKVAFHSMDAENIAIEDNSVDFVIGTAFVHHIDDINPLFLEINRVLKKGGLCFFYDFAYSRLWQKLKFTMLRPLVYATHKRSGISPQDTKATHRGGYKKSEILKIKETFSFDKHIYHRSGFFTNLFERFILKIIKYTPASYKLLLFLIPILNIIDKYLSKNLSFFRNNTLDLFWGFQK